MKRIRLDGYSLRVVIQGRNRRFKVGKKNNVVWTEAKNVQEKKRFQGGMDRANRKIKRKRKRNKKKVNGNGRHSKKRKV